MKTIIIGLLFLLACASCTSKSGKLVEQRELAAVETRLDAEIEETKQLEIERGYDAVIIENANVSYKAINDTVVVRTEDNVFFLKRKAPVMMKNTTAYRYYRLY
jgi:hypothetical protein